MTPSTFADAAGSRLATLVRSSARLCERFGAWVGQGVGCVLGVAILGFAAVFIAPPLLLWALFAKEVPRE